MLDACHLPNSASSKRARPIYWIGCGVNGPSPSSQWAVGVNGSEHICKRILPTLQHHWEQKRIYPPPPLSPFVVVLLDFFFVIQGSYLVKISPSIFDDCVYHLCLGWGPRQKSCPAIFLNSQWLAIASRIAFDKQVPPSSPLTMSRIGTPTDTFVIHIRMREYESGLAAVTSFFSAIVTSIPESFTIPRTAALPAAFSRSTSPSCEVAGAQKSLIIKFAFCSSWWLSDPALYAVNNRVPGLWALFSEISKHENVTLVPKHSS